MGKLHLLMVTSFMVILFVPDFTSATACKTGALANFKNVSLVKMFREAYQVDFVWIQDRSGSTKVHVDNMRKYGCYRLTANALTASLRNTTNKASTKLGDFEMRIKTHGVKGYKYHKTTVKDQYITIEDTKAGMFGRKVDGTTTLYLHYYIKGSQNAYEFHFNTCYNKKENVVVVGATANRALKKMVTKFAENDLESSVDRDEYFIYTGVCEATD